MLAAFKIYFIDFPSPKESLTLNFYTAAILAGDDPRDDDKNWAPKKTRKKLKKEKTGAQPLLVDRRISG